MDISRLGVAKTHQFAADCDYAAAFNKSAILSATDFELARARRDDAGEASIIFLISWVVDIAAISNIC